MKSLIVIVSILVISTCSYGQARIGLHSGVNVSRFTESEDLAPGATWSSKTGFTGGVSIGFEFAKNFVITAELNYIQKGIYTDVPLTTRVKSTILNHYVELPIHFRYSLPSGAFTFYLEVGPKVAYLFSSISDIQSPVENTTINSHGLFKKHDVSASLGSGIEYGVSDDLVLVFTVHHGRGLNRLFVTSTESRTRDVIIVAGVLFPIDL